MTQINLPNKNIPHSNFNNSNNNVHSNSYPQSFYNNNSSNVGGDVNINLNYNNTINNRYANNIPLNKLVYSNNKIDYPIQKNVNNGNHSRFSCLAKNDLNMNNRLVNMKSNHVFKNNKIDEGYNNNDNYNYNIDIEDQSRRYNGNMINYYSPSNYVESKNFSQNNISEFSFPLPFTYFKY